MKYLKNFENNTNIKDKIHNLNKEIKDSENKLISIIKDELVKLFKKYGLSNMSFQAIDDIIYDGPQRIDYLIYKNGDFYVEGITVNDMGDGDEFEQDLAWYNHDAVVDVYNTIMNLHTELILTHIKMNDDIDITNKIIKFIDDINFWKNVSYNGD